MVARGRGRLINVVSTSAFQPVPFLDVYGASKAFVLSFTEALATELQGDGRAGAGALPGPDARASSRRWRARTRCRFNRTAAMSPADVVELSLRALERGPAAGGARAGRTGSLAACQRFAPLALVAPGGGGAVPAPALSAESGSFEDLRHGR